MRIHGLVLVGSVLAGSRICAAQMTAVTLSAEARNPLFAAPAPGDHSRMYVVERAGAIRVFDLQERQFRPEPFLTIEGVDTRGENGLLGLAFHPRFQENGAYFVFYTRTPDAFAVVARYQATDSDHGQSEPSVVAVYAHDQTYNRHRGGWLGFGPNGYLHIGTGDDVFAGNAQSLASPHGKILRIDVDGPDAFPEDADRNFAIPPENPFIGIATYEEIWLLGLRNPYRCSFDRLTDELYIGDVGATSWEEVNWLASNDPGPRNYGWPLTEGYFDPAQHPDFTNPIYAYAWDGGAAIIGGYVYRGAAIPSLRGAYFFADIRDRRLFSLVNTGGTVTDVREWTDEVPEHTLRGMASFGEDLYGELYMCDVYNGPVHKYVPIEFESDCDADYIEDAQELAADQEQDCDQSGAIDDCEPDRCVADLAPPFGALNVFDFLAFQSAFGDERPCADLAEPNGIFNVFDFLAYQTAFGNGC